ncbi:2-hydroxyacid dehydrogenase [Corallococcus sp. M34]|uniref:2-hydroxyacid dehydrogenase n=1 Tax=Citreicoccus inhibens TaxID=2849499 RepID=UPI001C23264B|nr:2-hydroxyacid dehydrogenase [Citreicoccus inhibens]MBU8898684.1 2-hydroxyacid dehydrogenase [Citreicoccus inhibens]
MVTLPDASLIRHVTLPEQWLLDALQPLPPALRVGLWDLQSEPQGLALGDIEAVVLPYIGAVKRLPALQRVPRLRLVHTLTTGYDGVLAAVGDDVTVVTASGVHAASTAELAIGLMLASLRGIDLAARDQPEGRWNHVTRTSLADRKVLLVGVGGIGREIARRLAPFEVTLARVGTHARDDADGHVHGVTELVALARDAEILVVITPLTESTRGLVDARVLAALPDGALVVNVARGPVVDTAALTAEVLKGRLRAALDVMEPEPLPPGHPLWTAPGVLITPHLGGDTSAFAPRAIRLLRAQLARLAAGQPLDNVVRPGFTRA